MTMAVKTWNSAVPECGVLLSIVEEKGHPVKLYSGNEWPDSLSGQFDGESIRVRIGIGPWEFPILLHEFGHALGLEHVSETHDMDSIMNPSVFVDDTITSGDILRSKVTFGCF